MAKKVYGDDDGRTIADMSGIQRQPLFFPRLPKRDLPAPPAQPEPDRDRPWETSELSPEERRWYILGALKASMLVALAFIGGLGLVVLLFYLFA
ncbi:MAG: hypothetical protein K2M42_07265 [Oscillospiraceae bacterium]|nr:hypothetical protein [Oscillospiraceae bacterium]